MCVFSFPRCAAATYFQLEKCSNTTTIEHREIGSRNEWASLTHDQATRKQKKPHLSRCVSTKHQSLLKCYASPRFLLQKLIKNRDDTVRGVVRIHQVFCKLSFLALQPRRFALLMSRHICIFTLFTHQLLFSTLLYVALLLVVMQYMVVEVNDC